MKITKRIILLAMLISAVFIFTACANNNKKHDIPKSTAEAEESADAAFQGVLKAVDKENRNLTFVNFNYSNECVLGYSDASKIYNKSGTLTIPETLDEGLVVQVRYNSDTMMAKEVKVDENCWEYDNITKWSIDTDKKMITVSDRNYRYDDSVVVFNNGETPDVMCLNPVDKLKVYGVDKKICSIIVKEGHGYIRPVNYEEFVGGTVSVSYILNQPITENMLLVVREGMYEVEMKNGDLVGKRTVQVVRDTEAELDMINTVTNPPDEGQVEFDIWPPGTDVYVNGKLINYSEPLSLKYGEHSVTAALTGYTTYKGTLTVNSPNPTVIINLAEEIAEVEDEEIINNDVNNNVADDDDNDEENDSDSQSTTTSNTQTDNSSAGATQDESEIVYDKEHNMTVSAPEGAEVYLNGAYKGIAPCSFPKQIGTHTITLSRADSITKSYTVVTYDDDQEVKWSFPELVKK